MRFTQTEHKEIDIFVLEYPPIHCYAEVTIRFEDKHFHSCKYNFEGRYTFEQWQILGQIAEFIKAKQIEFNEA